MKYNILYILSLSILIISFESKGQNRKQLITKIKSVEETIIDRVCAEYTVTYEITILDRNANGYYLIDASFALYIKEVGSDSDYQYDLIFPSDESLDDFHKRVYELKKNMKTQELTLIFKACKQLDLLGLTWKTINNDDVKIIAYELTGDYGQLAKQIKLGTGRVDALNNSMNIYREKNNDKRADIKEELMNNEIKKRDQSEEELIREIRD